MTFKTVSRMTQHRTLAVRDDVPTDPSNVQTMVDNLPVADKRLM